MSTSKAGPAALPLAWPSLSWPHRLGGRSSPAQSSQGDRWAGLPSQKQEEKPRDRKAALISEVDMVTVMMG